MIQTLVLFLVSWTFREPAFTYTLSLMDYFQYAPERREGNYAKNCRPYKMTDHYRRYAEHNSCDCEDYPAFDTYVVFRLDYKWMEKSNNKECGESHKQSDEVHSKV